MPSVYTSQCSQERLDRHVKSICLLNVIIIIIYYYMIYIAPISRIESEALVSLGGEHD